MTVKVVVGAQWGDEGKGKIIDILASQADVVVRSQGGNNAGHTIEVGEEVYKLHLVPSGILYKDAKCFIGCGVVVDPLVLVNEMKYLQSKGLSFENFRIDPRAHVIMPWHIVLDKIYEANRQNDKIGTTNKGIGPCYMDKAKREGIRIYDLVNEQVFISKAQRSFKESSKLIRDTYDSTYEIDINKTLREYIKVGEYLKEYVEDVSVAIYRAIEKKQRVLFEGAQGTLLDLDMGTYPFVTSSHPTSGGACQGSGIGPTFIDEVVGVAKAYTTRVGEGPFPTELKDHLGESIREKGHEFGTTTGRARRVGWFDAVIIRHAVRVNGLTSLVLNKLDVLSGLETLKICVGYKLSDGTIIDEFPPVLEQLEECEPVYEEVAGFGQDISECKTFDELPDECKSYIKRITELCGCKISMVGVGPNRNQNLYL